MWYKKILNQSKTPFSFKRNASMRIAGAGLSRLRQHMLNGPFAIMTPYLSSLPKAENERRMIEFKQLLREMGYGFIDTEGAWSDVDATTDAPPRYVKERSLFVPGISAEEATELGRKFGQDGIIVGDKGEYSIMPVVGDWEPMEGEISDKTGEGFHVWKQDEQPDFYTDIRGKKFKLLPDEVEEEKETLANADATNVRIASKNETPNRCYYVADGPFAPNVGMYGVWKSAKPPVEVGRLKAYIPLVSTTNTR